MARDVSSERKAAHYGGLALMGLGLVIFVSNMITLAGVVEWDGESRQSGLVVAFLGMGLMLVGKIVHRIGARGLAGSGVVLDPEHARKDLEPYARMAGGLAKAALDEAGLAPGTRQVVLLECARCKRRNESDARFCQGCGQAL